MIDKYSLDIRIVVGGGGGGKGGGGEGAKKCGGRQWDGVGCGRDGEGKGLKKGGEGLIVIFPYKEWGAYRIVGLIWEGGVTVC